MNGQAFRRKLERAVEQRDQSALQQLEQMAGQSPTTARIWQDHILIEQAISQWRMLPEWQNVPASMPRPAERSQSPLPRRKVSWKQGMSLCLCLLAGWLVWGRLASDELEQGFSLVSLEESAGPASAMLMEGAASIQTALQQQETAVAQQMASPLWLNYTVVLADRGRTFIPGVGLLPVLPEVTMQLEQGVGATWQALTNLPTGMQEAWQKLYSPEPGVLPQVLPQEIEELESPQNRKPSRRGRPSRIFSQDVSEVAGVDALA